MNFIKESIINFFEDVMTCEKDLNSWAGLHFIQFCQEKDYQNASLDIFVEECMKSKNIWHDVEKLGFKYRTFAEKYLAAEEKETFLDRVYTAHYEHFQNQQIRGFEI